MDHSIFYFFYNFAHQSEIVDKIIVFFAVYFPYLVIFGAGLFLLFHHDIFRADNPFQVFLAKKKEILEAFFAGTLAYILAYILKYLFSMPRPFVALEGVQALILETGFAFPSSHATFFMALAISIFFFHKKIGYWLMFFALLIGIARIIAGVHFPLDILGGFILGAGMSYFVAYFVKNI